MEQIIAQVLKLHKLADQNYILDIEKIRLKDLIQAVCENEAEKWEETLRFSLSVQVSEIYADAGLMIIMLQNLVGNAVKYSMGTGRHAKSGTVVEISACCKNEDVLIQIRDYGCGIPAEKINAVFLPFYRAGKSMNCPGSGLGLSIAERIARIHGGAVYAESLQGRGSTFTVILPQLKR